MIHLLPWHPTRTQFTTVLAATTLAVYALITTGAALSSTGAAACSGWPVCLPDAGSVLTADVILVFGHRALTAVVGCLLVLTLLAALTVSLNRRARLALVGGAATFLIQIGIGALLALTTVPYARELHLAVAAAVFMFLLTALAWSLEDETVDPSDEEQQAGPTPDVEVAQTDTAGQASDDPGFDTVTERARAYLRLTKPRLMWLLCLLALAGMALATTTGQWPTGTTVAATLAGGVLAIGASGTFNHLYERDRDQEMERTADRPVATDRIPVRNAAVYGVGQAALSMAVLVAFVNGLAAALTAAAIVYYSVVYTVVLKPNTSWNIAIGGGSGALPALIGWAAVTGSVGLGGLLLAGLVVLWTPAHFYNLAIVYRDDYARAGYPMFPVVAGVPTARRRILYTLGGTLLSAVALVMLTPLGLVFALAAIVAGGGFLWSTVSQCRTHTRAATMRTFFVSIAYLGVVLGAIVVDTVVLLP
jgi:protoheme IX farnesyltransferase